MPYKNKRKKKTQNRKYFAQYYYYGNNRKKIAARRRKDYKNRPEFYSVRQHYYFIKNRGKSRITYQGMKFHDAWCPEKGGSYQSGADWIIANLGKRPKGTTLHIIDHEKGFVPGNLEWTGRKKQTNQQAAKIIAQLKHRIRELEEENTILRNKNGRL